MFKSGDIVRIKSGIDYPQNGMYYIAQNIVIGKTYEIKDYFSTLENGRYWSLKEIEEVDNNCLFGRWAFEFQMELVKPCLINNLNTMGLTEKFLSSLKKEPEKSRRKAGVTNGDDIPTDEGIKFICTILLQSDTFDEFKKSLDKAVKEIVKDEEDKK